MNTYIVPICDILDNKVYNKKIVANSLSECKDKLMEDFSDISESSSYTDFVKNLRDNDFLIGKITDIEEL